MHGPQPPQTWTPKNPSDFNRVRQKIDQLENHSQKFNIRIIGLPEGAEAGNPTAFTTKLLYELFGQETI